MSGTEIQGSQVVTVVKNDLSVIMNLTLRLIFLGITVFAATTYLTTNQLSLEIRGTIAVVVVAVYILLDSFWGSFDATKKKLCKLICGCEGRTVTGPKLTL